LSYAYQQNRKAKKMVKKLNPVVESTPEVNETIEKPKKELPETKIFKVTFSDNSKYHLTTRTITVQAYNKQDAENMAHHQFGSFVHKYLLGFSKIKWPTEPSNKITILRCVEIDKNGNEVQDIKEFCKKNIQEIVELETNYSGIDEIMIDKPKRSRKKRPNDLQD
jgi:predicted translin family RNA/ssDNA-binding protein